MLDLIAIFLVAFSAVVGMTYLHYALYYTRVAKYLGMNPWRMAWRSLQFKSPVEWDRVKATNAEGNR